MTKYNVTLVRVEYLTQVIEVDADNIDDAQDRAWDLSGDWKCVNAEEFCEQITEV